MQFYMAAPLVVRTWPMWLHGNTFSGQNVKPGWLHGSTFSGQNLTYVIVYGSTFCDQNVTYVSIWQHLLWSERDLCNCMATPLVIRTWPMSLYMPAPLVVRTWVLRELCPVVLFPPHHSLCFPVLFNSRLAETDRRWTRRSLGSEQTWRDLLPWWHPQIQVRVYLCACVLVGLRVCACVLMTVHL